MDRRQQKTRKAIFTAFERLLARRSYDKITVQEIIDEANVGRTTFYAHFETKDALLRELCTELFDHVFSGQITDAHSHGLGHGEGDTRTMVAHMLFHLQENGRNLGRLLSGESSEAFLRYFKEYLNKMVDTCLLSHLDRKNPRVPEDFLKNHVTGSFVNMVQWWLQGGMKQTPEELADIFLAVIEPIL